MKDFRALWSEALSFEQFVAAAAPEHTGLWGGIYHLARVPAWGIAAAAELPPLHLLVLARDWCGDASNTIPALAKWGDHAPGRQPPFLRGRQASRPGWDRYLPGRGPRHPES